MPAKYKVRITQAAEDDLESIWNYISTDSPAQATRFVESLEDQLVTLEKCPERCPWIRENDLLRTAYRHLVLGHYRAIFRLESRTVLVLRIIHAARLLDASLFGP